MSNVKYLLTNLCLIFFLGCSPQERNENQIVMGTITGPETRLVEVAQKVAKEKYGLDLKIVTFEDYIMPNTALAEGELDANMFQHQPYLDVVLAKQHYEISSIGKMFVYPMGVYSKKINNLNQLKEGAIIGIPNDPSNGARALRLLAKSHLITIKEVDDLSLTPKAILDNPKKLIFKEIAAAQLPRALPDLDAAVINTNYAIPAGLVPAKDALLLEDKDSPYVNIVVVRTKDKDQEKFKKLMQSLHSDEVVAEAQALFQGNAIAGW